MVGSVETDCTFKALVEPYAAGALYWLGALFHQSL